MMNSNSHRARPQLWLAGCSNRVKVYGRWKCKKIWKVKVQNNIKVLVKGSKEKA